MTDDEIREIADDNDSGRTTSGRRLFSDRNLFLFARAIEQASRRSALEECCTAIKFCEGSCPDGDYRTGKDYLDTIRALSGPTET